MKQLPFGGSWGSVREALSKPRGDHLLKVTQHHPAHCHNSTVSHHWLAAS